MYFIYVNIMHVRLEIREKHKIQEEKTAE